MSGNREKVFLSVIIPVFNVGSYIKGTLHSLLNQIEKDFEIIIVNDGSTDDSLFHIKELTGSFSPQSIRILTQENKGPSSARNLGLQYASGSYVFFLDADDLIHPCLVKFLKDLSLEEPDLIFWNYEKSQHKPSSLYLQKKIFCESPEAQIFKGGCDLPYQMYVEKQFWIVTPSIAFSKTFLKRESLIFPEKFLFGEDPNLVFKALVKARKVIRIKKKLTTVIERPESFSHKLSPRYFDMIYSFLDMANFGKENLSLAPSPIKSELLRALTVDWPLSVFSKFFFRTFRLLRKQQKLSFRAAYEELMKIMSNYPDLNEKIGQMSRTHPIFSRSLFLQKIMGLMFPDPSYSKFLISWSAYEAVHFFIRSGK